MDHVECILVLQPVLNIGGVVDPTDLRVVGNLNAENEWLLTVEAIHVGWLMASGGLQLRPIPVSQSYACFGACTSCLPHRFCVVCCWIDSEKSARLIAIHRGSRSLELCQGLSLCHRDVCSQIVGRR